MASGTRMTLHRYGVTTLDWEPVEIIVDSGFIENNGLFVPIEPLFVPGKGMLEVFYNGQFLRSGGGYVELEQAIKLNLGLDYDTGLPIQLIEGDEIFIKVHKNQYCSRGGGEISSLDFYELRKEVYDARSYKDSSEPFPTLDDRLDFIQQSIELIEKGMANIDIEYEENDKGQVVKQVITGEYDLVREFEFDDRSEISKETIQYGDYTVVKDNTYDPFTGRLLRTRVRVQ